MNGHGIEKKEGNNNLASENYSGGGKKSNCVTKLYCEMLCSASIINNKILRKASILKEERLFGTH
jgi:hypothetical protein